MPNLRLKSRTLIPRVFIRESVLEKMSKYRQLAMEPESGGILLGEFYPNEAVIRILFASKPGKSDSRSLFSFRRDAKRSTRLARTIWRQSGGRIHYLGEWHTHPEDVPSPSCTDRLSMGRLVRRSTVVTGGLVLLILGRQTDYAAFWTIQDSRLIHLEVEDSPTNAAVHNSCGS